MSFRKITVLWLACVLLASLPFASAAEPAGGERVRALFGGEMGLTPLEHFKRVEVFRLSGFEMKPDAEVANIGRYPITAGPLAVDKKLAQELARIFSSDATYPDEAPSLCELMPGVAVRFVGEKSTTDILLCYECDELKILPGGKIAPFQSDRLREIVIKLFPNDPEIQALKGNAP